jgi:hypothetical protein
LRPLDVGDGIGAWRRIAPVSEAQRRTLARVTEHERAERLTELAGAARAAEDRGEGWRASEVWRRYELVRDGGRDPDELLADGIALSVVALELADRAEQREA